MYGISYSEKKSLTKVIGVLTRLENKFSDPEDIDRLNVNFLEADGF